MTAAAGWRVDHVMAPVATLHDTDGLVGHDAVRLVRFCRPEASAVVIGSTQPDPPADRLAVVRRKSGGGAVLVEPDGLVWVDLVIPRGDPLWDDDVGRAVWWAGETWVAALAMLGVDGLGVHRGAMVRSPWSRAVCFAGIGPGEVLAGERKVVGISQRRTRHAALFQCALLRRWEPARLVSLLGLTEDAVADLADVARPLPDISPASVEDAVAQVLPP